MPVWLPLMVLVAVSVAVIDWLPAVFKVHREMPSLRRGKAIAVPRKRGRSFQRPSRGEKAGL